MGKVDTTNDVFISCKNLDEHGVQTRDSEIAAEVYNFLTGKGLSVFLSTFTLEQLGAAAYTREIDSALESATVLLAIGTSADHLNSEWVRYEWDSFSNVIRSGDKPNGRVFTYVEGMPIRALPWALRPTQTLVHSRASLEHLYNFINNALPPSPEKREREEEGRLKAKRAETETKGRVELERQLPLERVTKEHPWVNSLGMKFVHVVGTQVLFSVWDTRVQDFEAFVADTDYDATGGMWYLGKGEWKQRRATWTEPGFRQGPTHPVVGVNWNDAKKFCEWLTRHEQVSGMLPREWVYRLPTDAEWSAGVGLQGEAETNPKEKDGRIELYPWGKEWPPPEGAGNYAGEEVKTEDWPAGWGVIEGYNDDYPRASPVGGFAANANGLYDMGGNVWQWCEDPYDPTEKRRVLRGASWISYYRNYLLASCRYCGIPDYRSDNIGFRCVVGTKSSR